jgi:hypothetical protein
MQLTKFTVSGWFHSNKNDTTENSVSSQFIVAKGGVGQVSSGNNLNYGMWMAAAGMLNAGFETSNGTDVFIGSPRTYNNNKWHYSIATYDGSSLRLYADGIQVANKSTRGWTPDNSVIIVG